MQNFDGMGDDERGFSTKTAGLRKRLWWKQRCPFVKRWLNSTEKSASSKRALQRTRSNKPQKKRKSMTMAHLVDGKCLLSPLQRFFYGEKVNIPSLRWRSKFRRWRTSMTQRYKRIQRPIGKWGSRERCSSSSERSHETATWRGGTCNQLQGTYPWVTNPHINWSRAC